MILVVLKLGYLFSKSIYKLVKKFIYLYYHLKIIFDETDHLSQKSFNAKKKQK